ncbi:MAG: hypothetical protein ACK5O7_05225 [Holosporales bacterium]
MANHDALMKVQMIASRAMQAYEKRMEVGMGNMANAQSVGYVPKGVSFQATVDRATGVEVVKANRPQAQPNRVRQQYDPQHPLANADGYVSMPVVDPLVQMMDVTQAKQDMERAMKVYENATDLQYKTIKLISGN